MMIKIALFIVLIMTIAGVTVEAQQGAQNDQIIQAHGQAITARNMAIQNPTLDNLTHAADLFDTVCARIPDGDYEHAIYYIYSRYAKAWLLFHAAELTADARYLIDADNAFDEVAGLRANENIGIEALYMAGESKLRAAILKTYRSLYDDEYAAAAASVEQLCRDAEDIFGRVAGKNAIMPRLAQCAALRKADAIYRRGRSAEIEGRFEDARKLFAGFSYNAVSLPSGDEWKDIKDYSEAMRRLHLFICSPDQLAPDSAIMPPLETDFRLGNIDHVRGLRLYLFSDSQQVGESVLAVADSLYYQKAAAGGMDESEYWQGYIEFFLKKDAAFESFTRFSTVPGDTINFRLLKLKEDARLKAILADTSAASIDSSKIDSILTAGSNDAHQRVVLGISIAEYLIHKANYAYFNAQYQNYYPIYWKKSLAFLKSVCPWGANDTLCHKATFLKGIIYRLVADTVPDYTAKALAYFNAADTFNSVGGAYAAEGQYARAVCMLEGWAWDKNGFPETLTVARTLFRSLIQDHRSLRAYYRLANSYRDGLNDSLARENAFRIIREKARGHKDFSFLVDLAKGDTTVKIMPDKHPLAGISTGNLQCPDYLIDDHEIFYEKVANRDVSLLIFLEESVDKLRQLMAPKLSLYPGRTIPAFTLHPGDAVPQYTIFPDPSLPSFAVVPESFSEVTAGIPDIHLLDSTWNLMVCVKVCPDKQGVIPKPKVTIPNLNPAFGGPDLSPVGAGCYEIKSICGDSVLVLHISDTSFYYVTLTLPGRRQTGLDTTVVLSKIITYPKVERTNNSSSIVPVRPDKDSDFLFIVCPDTSIHIPNELKTRFNDDINLRDFAYDAKQSQFLIVDKSLTHQIRACDSNGVWKTLNLIFDTASPNMLHEPEGIAVDNDGTIYIADWGNHRIAIFKNDGTFIGQFGGAGTKGSPNSGAKAKLTFPTRLDIEEDTASGGAITCEKHLLVADRYGIHKIDMRGYYLDTPIPADVTIHPIGSFYDFKIDGYGGASTITMVDRRDGTVYIYTPIGK